MYLIGLDRTIRYTYNINNSTYIYHGHHGNSGIFYYHIILPSKLFIEQNNFFINCEGRFLNTTTIVNSVKKENSNESIIYNLFTFIFSKFNFFLVDLSLIFIYFYYNIPIFFIKKISFIRKNIYISLYFLFFYKKHMFDNIFNYYDIDILSKNSFYLSYIRYKNFFKKNFYINY